MKYFFILILFLSIISLTSACIYSNNVTTIQVQNQSSRTIDSVIFYINSHKCKTSAIMAGKILSFKVSQDTIPSNSHDLTLFPTAYLSDTVIKGHGLYNDLTGSLFEYYSFILTPDLNFKRIIK